MKRIVLPAIAFLLAISLLVPPAGVAAEGGHADPYAIVFEGMAVVLVAASVGRWAARCLKQSPVLGELAAGILAGALLYHAGNPAVVLLRHADILKQAEATAMAEHVNWEEAVRSVLEDGNIGGETAEKVARVALLKDYPALDTLYRSLLLVSSLGVTRLLFMVGLESSL